MSQIKWETPPENPTRSSKYDAVDKALGDNPGQWAVVSEDATRAQVVNLRRSEKNFNPPDHFEFRGVTNGVPGRCRIYVRYVGEVTA